MRFATPFLLLLSACGPSGPGEKSDETGTTGDTTAGTGGDGGYATIVRSDDECGPYEMCLAQDTQAVGSNGAAWIAYAETSATGASVRVVARDPSGSWSAPVEVAPLGIVDGISERQIAIAVDPTTRRSSSPGSTRARASSSAAFRPTRAPPGPRRRRSSPATRRRSPPTSATARP